MKLRYKKIAKIDQYFASLRAVNGVTVRCPKQCRQTMTIW